MMEMTYHFRRPSNAKKNILYKPPSQQQGNNTMLILNRRVGENIVIGDDITVTVLGVSRNQIKIGVKAPKHVSVHREEIYARIQSENKQEAKL